MKRTKLLRQSSLGISDADAKDKAKKDAIQNGMSIADADAYANKYAEVFVQARKDGLTVNEAHDRADAVANGQPEPPLLTTQQKNDKRMAEFQARTGKSWERCRTKSS